MKDDDKAYIFTLKNAHGVEPTRYMKREESDCAIVCDPDCGPRFGDKWAHDISIRDKCNEENRCSIWNDGTRAYECHSKYKMSLFVNSNKPDDENEFSVLDYEVYTHD